MKRYYVYIMASHSSDPVLYIGVTNNLAGRVMEHKSKLIPSTFTSSYNCNKLVYYEATDSVEAAIAREKQLKRWHRQWKINLIRQSNPDWRDLARDFIDHETLKRVQGDRIVSDVSR